MLAHLFDIKGIPNGEHGFHIHEYGNIEPKMKDGKMVSGLSAGKHYDPLNAGYHPVSLER